MEFTLQKPLFFFIFAGLFLHFLVVSGKHDLDLDESERVELFASLKCPTAKELFHHLFAAANGHHPLPATDDILEATAQPGQVSIHHEIPITKEIVRTQHHQSSHDIAGSSSEEATHHRKKSLPQRARMMGRRILGSGSSRSRSATPDAAHHRETISGEKAIPEPTQIFPSKDLYDEPEPMANSLVERIKHSVPPELLAYILAPYIFHRKLHELASRAFDKVHDTLSDDIKHFLMRDSVWTLHRVKTDTREVHQALLRVLVVLKSLKPELAIFYAFEALRKVHSLESIEIDTDFLVSQYISDIIACTKHIGKPQQLIIPKDFGKKAEELICKFTSHGIEKKHMKIAAQLLKVAMALATRAKWFDQWERRRFIIALDYMISCMIEAEEGKLLGKKHDDSDYYYDYYSELMANSQEFLCYKLNPSKEFHVSIPEIKDSVPKAGEKKENIQIITGSILSDKKKFPKLIEPICRQLFAISGSEHPGAGPSTNHQHHSDVSPNIPTLWMLVLLHYAAEDHVLTPKNHRTIRSMLSNLQKKNYKDVNKVVELLRIIASCRLESSLLIGEDTKAANALNCYMVITTIDEHSHEIMISSLFYMRRVWPAISIEFSSHLYYAIKRQIHFNEIYETDISEETLRYFVSEASMLRLTYLAKKPKEHVLMADRIQTHRTIPNSNLQRHKDTAMALSLTIMHLASSMNFFGSQRISEESRSSATLVFDSLCKEFHGMEGGNEFKTFRRDTQSPEELYEFWRKLKVPFEFKDVINDRHSANEFEAQHFCSIHYQEEVGVAFQRKCGCSPIHNFYVVTSAHCLRHHIRTWEPLVETRIKIIMGTKHFVYSADPLHEQYEILNTFVHEDFRHDFMESGDIALIQLKKEVVHRKHHDGKTVVVTRIPEISKERLGVGLICEFVGFGRPRPGFARPKILQVLSLETTHFDNRGGAKLNYDKRALYTRIDNYVQTRFGDSGGPLTYKGKLVGVCAYSGKRVDVFMRLSDYLGWINTKCNNCIP